jgi:L-ascorbate metabolism protein UlaG (beta-lactamase superfamily)
MEITWYGHACFRIRGRDVVVVTDPYDKTLGYPLPRPRADVVTVSNDHPHHAYVDGVKGEFKVIKGPGEFEVKGVFITGIPTIAKKEGTGPLRNTIYVFELEDLTVCHLGVLGHMLAQTQVEALGNVDILLVPVGGRNMLNASRAAEVVSVVEPWLVIPMAYKTKEVQLDLDPLDRFLKEMGLPETPAEDSLKVSKSSLPDQTQVVLLNCKA